MSEFTDIGEIPTTEQVSDAFVRYKSKIAKATFWGLVRITDSYIDGVPQETTYDLVRKELVGPRYLFRQTANGDPAIDALVKDTRLAMEQVSPTREKALPMGILLIAASGMIDAAAIQDPRFYY